MAEKFLKIVSKMKNYKKLEKNWNDLKQKNKNYPIRLKMVDWVELNEKNFKKN
jgi:hypothetical protein